MKLVYRSLLFIVLILPVMSHRPPTEEDPYSIYIEQKGSALLWQYRDADPALGHMQSKELEDHLSGVLRGAAVEILRGENNALHGGYL